MAQTESKKRRSQPDSKSNKKAKRKEKDAAEKELEDLLFGAEEEDQQLAEHEESDENLDEPASEGRKAAWEDEDDEQVLVDVDQSNRTRKLRESKEEEGVLSGNDYVARLRSLRAKHTRGSNDWAKHRDDQDEDDGLRKLARRASGLQADAASARMKSLGSQSLLVKRVKDANCAAPSKAVVQEVQFHRKLPLLITAGFDKTLRVFQADGQSNSKLQSIFLEDLPIRRAQFLPNSNSIIMTGRRPFYYVHDLQSGHTQRVQGCNVNGQQVRSLEDVCVSQNSPLMAFLAKDGYVVLTDTRSRRHVANLKMNGSARAAGFTADGNELLTGGDEGCLYVWDVRTQRCSARMEDDGALKTTCIQCSPDGKFFAAGSDSGVVNIYDAKKRAGKPVKAIMNLTTAIDNLRFNHDSQILAISSRFKKESLKMVHLQSMTVFQNWPTGKTPLSTVSSIDFSPNSSYFTIGNDRGKALMYSLCDYYAG